MLGLALVAVGACLGASPATQPRITATPAASQPTVRKIVVRAVPSAKRSMGEELLARESVGRASVHVQGVRARKSMGPPLLAYLVGLERNSMNSRLLRPAPVRAPASMPTIRPVPIRSAPYVEEL
jgi:hypothetical protein